MTQKEALDVLKLGYNVFLTGSAGSGKTFVLENYINYLKSRTISVGVTASSGIAAAHINGITVYSWAGIGVRRKLTDSDIEDLLKRRYLKVRILRSKVIIIDEVSMLPDYCLDMVDRVCRAFKNNDLPFGGMQVVLAGDFFQLPPVERNGNKVKFAYESSSWQQLNLRVCYLEKEYRQDDELFLRILHEIRNNQVSSLSKKILMSRMKQYYNLRDLKTKLYTHNTDVDKLNDQELSKLSGLSHEYMMKTKGSEYLVKVMKKSCLAPDKLILKIGAYVMFVKNNFEAGYVNGMLGTVVDFDKKGFPIVKTVSGNTFTVTPVLWNIDEPLVQAQLKQIPLRLAWAITIHKSQGMTLDNAEINLGNAFDYGMGYVALSRVRTLNGVYLTGLNERALEVNHEVLHKDHDFQTLSQQTCEELKDFQWLEKQKKQNEFIRYLKSYRQKNFEFSQY